MLAGSRLSGVLSIVTDPPASWMSLPQASVKRMWASDCRSLPSKGCFTHGRALGKSALLYGPSGSRPGWCATWRQRERRGPREAHEGAVHE